MTIDVYINGKHDYVHLPHSLLRVALKRDFQTWEEAQWYFSKMIAENE